MEILLIPYFVVQSELREKKKQNSQVTIHSFISRGSSLFLRKPQKCKFQQILDICWSILYNWYNQWEAGKRKNLNLCFQYYGKHKKPYLNVAHRYPQKWVKTEGVQNIHSKIFRKRKLLIVYFQIRYRIDFHHIHLSSQCSACNLLSLLRSPALSSTFLTQVQMKSLGLIHPLTAPVWKTSSSRQVVTHSSC